MITWQRSAAQAVVMMGVTAIVWGATREPVHAGAAPVPGRSGADTSSSRPTAVSLVMQNSRTYGGTYQASGTSRICGYGPLRDMAGFVHGFTLMFPDGEPSDIIDINFSADTLPIGTTTPSFYISISLKAKNGGRPAAYVLRANKPQYKETGTASLTVQGGVATLRVVGRNDMGESMDMTAVCQPKRGP